LVKQYISLISPILDVANMNVNDISEISKLSQLISKLLH